MCSPEIQEKKMPVNRSKQPLNLWVLAVVVGLLSLTAVAFPNISRGGAASSTGLPASPSDNEASYNWPAEQDTLTYGRNAIRKELKDMKSVLSKLSSVQTWQVAAIQEWYKGHNTHVSEHCRRKSSEMYPLLSKRLVGFNAGQMKKDHKAIDQNLKEINGLIAGGKLTESSTKKDLDKLRKAWGKHESTLLSHFQEEERQTVVPIRREFPAGEWQPIIRKFFDNGPKIEYGSVINAMGEKHFRQTFMKKRGMPGFLWNVSFSKKHKYYETNMFSFMKALQKGVPP